MERAETADATSAGAIAGPDEGRLSLLFRMHGHEAKRLAYLMTGDAALAEDLAQEAFIKAAGKLAHLRDPDRFPGYLRACVINLTRMHFRRRKLETAAPDEPPPPALDLEQGIDLQRGLARLGHRQRTAIVLRYYADLPDGEIADLLHCRQATVRSLVARGLSALRMEMFEWR